MSTTGAQAVREAIFRKLLSAACAGALLGTALGASGCGGDPNAASDANEVRAAAAFTPLVDPELKLLVTPSAAGHEPFIEAIAGAAHTVRMVMFHLTDAQVIQALVAARERGVDVEVILDQSSIAASAGYAAAYTTLKAAHVNVVKSSSAFSITHEKSIVIDGSVAFITAMNMTNDAATTRDFGVVTRDAKVIAEWNAVFAADLTNAKYQTANTPALKVPSLVWSPVDSENKLAELIASAKSTIDATSESLNDAAILAAFEAAARRGVLVRLMVPMCDQNPNPLLNYPALATLESKGVSARMMPYPATPAEPYMHSKMILVDETVAYVGSINFTTNSTGSAREAGVIFSDSAAAATIRSTFEADWKSTVAVPKSAPTICPTTP